MVENVAAAAAAGHMAGCTDLKKVCLTVEEIAGLVFVRTVGLTTVEEGKIDSAAVRTECLRMEVEDMIAGGLFDRRDLVCELCRMHLADLEGQNVKESAARMHPAEIVRMAVRRLKCHKRLAVLVGWNMRVFAGHKLLVAVYWDRLLDCRTRQALRHTVEPCCSWTVVPRK